ncbi:MAG: TIGR03067 domain-containing protein, partial [Pirellulales bacterium]
EEAIARDRQRIEGTWVLVGLEIDGKAVSEEDARKLSVINGADGTWSLWSEGEELSRGTSTFDPTQEPKALDFTPTTGDSKGQLFLGIYELGDDARKMCFAPTGKPRPTEFNAPAGTGHICVKFERVKAE